MPDASDPRGRAPLGWGEAFGKLPLESAPADAWSRVAAHLDARIAPAPAPAPAAPTVFAARHPGRRRFARTAGWLGAATAAALALVVAWPRHDAPRPTPTTRDAATPAVALATHAAPNAASTPAPATSSANAPTGDDLAVGTNTPKHDDTAIALPKVVESARKPRLASRDVPARTKASQPKAGTAVPEAEDARLDALYAESARLEALLALARDERVSSASAALLASALDAQVAGVDARLAEPGLDATQRTALWQARVDALRQAAGFESTQRVLASQGDGGALLVSVD
jgi:hypothetical protein